ncbi:hypothetical protein [Actinoalloteichus spitiensis]|uniref:hypothetical protein n=1 Tax=Actinoalloteichus spitiensis TaxID=252394 RepID=UPI00036D0D89|nr:hypothetical protein [Actinoalloteichus spitiensis]
MNGTDASRAPDRLAEPNPGLPRARHPLLSFLMARNTACIVGTVLLGALASATVGAMTFAVGGSVPVPLPFAVVMPTLLACAVATWATSGVPATDRGAVRRLAWWTLAHRLGCSGFAALALWLSTPEVVADFGGGDAAAVLLALTGLAWVLQLVLPAPLAVLPVMLVAVPGFVGLYTPATGGDTALVNGLLGWLVGQDPWGHAWLTSLVLFGAGLAASFARRGVPRPARW